MNRPDTLCAAVRERLPRAASITDFWNDAIEAAAQAAEEIARNELQQASGGFFIALGANESAAAIRKLKR